MGYVIHCIYCVTTSNHTILNNNISPRLSSSYAATCGDYKVGWLSSSSGDTVTVMVMVAVVW